MNKEVGVNFSEGPVGLKIPSCVRGSISMSFARVAVVRRKGVVSPLEVFSAKK